MDPPSMSSGLMAKWNHRRCELLFAGFYRRHFVVVSILHEYVDMNIVDCWFAFIVCSDTGSVWLGRVL